MSEFYTLITDIGRKKLAEAVANKKTLELSAFAVGDGDYEPTGKETQLKHENYRSIINSKDVNPDDIEQIRLELIIPANIGGWYIREIGLFDIDNDLFAIAKYPATYKPAATDGAILKQFIIKAYLQVVNTENVTLDVKAENLATRDYVDNTLRANQEETNEGLNDNKYVTPKTLHNKKATTAALGLTRFATPEEVINPLIDDVTLSPMNIIPLLEIKPKSLTTDKFADLSITTDKIVDNSVITNKISDGAITSNKIQRYAPFEFNSITIPRYSGGDNSVAVIQDIINQNGGIVASGGGWVKFAKGLILQMLRCSFSDKTHVITITLPIAFLNRDSFYAFGTIYSAASTSDAYSILIYNTSNSQANVFIPVALAESGNVQASIFCIGY